MVKRCFHQQTKGRLAFHGRRRYRQQPDHPAHHLGRRLKSAGGYVEQVVYLIISLYKHTDHPIGLITRGRRHALGHFFLEHTGNGFYLRTPVEQLKKDLRGNIVREIAHHGKRFAERRIDVEKIAMDQLAGNGRVGLLEVGYLLVIQLHRPEIDPRQGQ